MSDCMTSPDTVEDFMEQHKVVDTDCVYSNGIEFVPIFRMKQWFAAQPEIIRCKDCKHYIRSNATNLTVCNKYNGLPYTVEGTDFCSRAERRTDGVDS